MYNREFSYKEILFHFCETYFRHPVHFHYVIARTLTTTFISIAIFLFVCLLFLFIHSFISCSLSLSLSRSAMRFGRTTFSIDNRTPYYFEIGIQHFSISLWERDGEVRASGNLFNWADVHREWRWTG